MGKNHYSTIKYPSWEKETNSVIAVINRPPPYFECNIFKTKNGTSYAKSVSLKKKQSIPYIVMAEPGKSRFLLLSLIQTKINDMGIGGLVIATVFLCIAILLIAEFKERYL